VIFSLNEDYDVFITILFVFYFAHALLDLYLDYTVPLEPCLEEFEVKLHIIKLVVGTVMAIEVFSGKLGNVVALFCIVVLPFFMNLAAQYVHLVNWIHSKLDFTDPNVNQNHVLKNAENLIYYDLEA
jgi:hypothetical protein